MLVSAMLPDSISSPITMNAALGAAAAAAPAVVAVADVAPAASWLLLLLLTGLTALAACSHGPMGCMPRSASGMLHTAAAPQGLWLTPCGCTRHPQPAQR